MWKPNQPANASPSPSNEPVRPAVPSTPAYEPTPAATRPLSAVPAASSATQSTTDQATIGKSLIVKGEVSGSESLYTSTARSRARSICPATG
jgi:hypothetical protein